MKRDAQPLRKLTPGHRRAGVDLTGERLGTCTAIRPTGESCISTQSHLWLFRCDCGREYELSLSNFRSYKRVGKRIRCYCAGYRALVKASGIVYARRCGLCKSTDHAIASCPNRKPAKWCNTCGSLTHRVPGIKCPECGLRFQNEKPVELDVTRVIGSSAGQLERYALGGDTGDSQNRRPSKRRAA